MSKNSLAFRHARDLVQSYGNVADDIIPRHQEAMDCWECEDLLQMGIDSFEWIVRATKEIRSSAVRSDDPILAEAEDSLRKMRIAWLKPCDFAEKWAASQRDRNFTLRNLSAFQSCRDTMRAIVAEDEKMAAIAAKVPTAEDLSLIAIEPPREWLNEPAWSKD